MPPPNDFSPQNPVSPKSKSDDIKADVNEFVDYLRMKFGTFLRNNVQLPLWQPSLELDDHTQRHIAGLEIPIIDQSSEHPMLLLHNLGQPSHDPQLADRVQRLFRLGSK